MSHLAAGHRAWVSQSVHETPPAELPLTHRLTMGDSWTQEQSPRLAQVHASVAAWQVGCEGFQFEPGACVTGACVSGACDVVGVVVTLGRPSGRRTSISTVLGASKVARQPATSTWLVGSCWCKANSKWNMNGPLAEARASLTTELPPIGGRT